MKRNLIIFISFLLFAPSVMAATIVSEFQTVVDKNETQEMAPVLITSTSDGDITAKSGIRILLVPAEKVLWGDATLSITGKAIDNGKVNLNVKPEYSADRKSVFFPVMKDFVAGEWLSIQGLMLRGYDESFNDQTLGLDLNGDFKADVSDINIYRVGNDAKTDLTPPFPVQNAKYTKNANGSITLTWNQPPDYDYEGTIIDRTRVKDGSSQIATVYSDYTTGFTDTSDYTGVTSLSYKLIAKDTGGNQSDPLILTVDLTAPTKPTVPTAPTTPTTPTTPATEVQELNKLLSYYNVRYSIKCMPSGVAVAQNDSGCLWARIDLVYAQTITKTVKVAGLILSAQDLSLMKARRQWPEARYQDNCITAEQPAAYCSALGKALDRISYFLD